MVTQKVKKSTTGKYHFIDDEDYYLCNRAVGKHKDIEELNFHKLTMLIPTFIDGGLCLNCLNKYVGGLKKDRKYLNEAIKVKRKRLT